MKQHCEFCTVVFEIPYRMLGAMVVCPTCNRLTNTNQQLGVLGSIDDVEQYEMAYVSFLNLIRNQSPRDYISSVLGVTFSLEDGLISVYLKNGESISLLNIHLKIQSDIVIRRRLYMISMEFFR